jgi:hypothetical protein
MECELDLMMILASRVIKSAAPVKAINRGFMRIQSNKLTHTRSIVKYEQSKANNKLPQDNFVAQDYFILKN